MSSRIVKLAYAAALAMPMVGAVGAAPAHAADDCRQPYGAIQGGSERDATCEQVGLHLRVPRAHHGDHGDHGDHADHGQQGGANGDRPTGSNYIVPFTLGETNGSVMAVSCPGGDSLLANPALTNATATLLGPANQPTGVSYTRDADVPQPDNNAITCVDDHLPARF
jgi:hypothetical protein